MKLEEQQRSQTKLSECTLDLAIAARLASAEAIATALTEAATSAAAGEVDGSEAGKAESHRIAYDMGLASRGNSCFFGFVVYWVVF
jgi:hypothetical protein